MHPEGTGRLLPFAKVPLVAILLLGRARRVFTIAVKNVAISPDPAHSLRHCWLLASSFVEDKMISSAVLTHMEHIFRTKNDDPRQVYFLVDRGAGHRIATSETLDTICKLESGLAVLLEAVSSPEPAVVERDAKVTSLGSAARRIRVRFRGRLDDEAVRELLRGAMTATLIDERPNGHRRADVSGRLCDLGHSPRS